ICSLLLEHGALVDDADDDHGDTPLHVAAVSGNLDIARLLLKHPAVDGSNARALRCRARNMYGRTALHNAALWGRVEVCRLLLKHGAVVNDEDNDGYTPL
ncbi:ankyrin, partial [Peniophora sp. CONT]